MSVRVSIAWTYLSQAVCFFVTFASTIVVARIVSPRDFGIFAMAAAVTTVINVFMQFGLAKYIMREAELSPKALQQVFTVNVLMSLLYTVSILVGAYSSDYFFDSPEVGRFLLVFAIFPLFAMMEFVPAAICAREMRFGVIATMSMVRAVVMAVVTIYLAWLGYAYMSFAWAQVLAWIATSIGFNIAAWRPDAWRLRLKGTRKILHFGAQMIGISGIGQLGTRAGEMTLGSMIGLSGLGLYSRASSLPAVLQISVFSAGSNVIFSRLSSDLRERGEFHETYLRFMRLLLGILWPMMFGIAVLAQPIIHILYGEKWQAAATPLALLTIATAITVAIGMVTEIFILRRRTKQQVRIELIRATVGYVFFAAGASVSLTLAAAARILEALLGFMLYRKPMMQLVGGPEGATRQVYLEAALVTSAAVVPASLLMFWCDWSPTTPISLLFGAVFLGVGAWVTLLSYLRHPLYLEGTRLMKISAQRLHKGTVA